LYWKKFDVMQNT